MTLGVNHITISVSDIRRSLDFYTRVLGMHRVATWSCGACLTVGSVWIALVQENAVTRIPREEYSHVAFTVARLDNRFGENHLARSWGAEQDLVLAV